MNPSDQEPNPHLSIQLSLSDRKALNLALYKLEQAKIDVWKTKIATLENAYNRLVARGATGEELVSSNFQQAIDDLSCNIRCIEVTLRMIEETEFKWPTNPLQFL